MPVMSGLVQPEVARVSVKIPPFFRKNARVWFWQIEAQFQNNQITSELTKYNYLVGNLDTEIAELVTDIIGQNLSSTPYTDLKNRLLQEFEETESRKAKKLLTEMELGDKKPSALLRQMKALAGTNVTNEFLRTIFLDRLPVTARSVLAASSSEDLESIALMADKILEVISPTQYVYTMQGENPHSSPLAPNEERLSRLEKTLAEMSLHLTELVKTERQPRSRSRSEQSPYRRRSRSNSRKRHKQCWYHFKFGEDARQCNKPCEFQTKTTPQENSNSPH